MVLLLLAPIILVVLFFLVSSRPKKLKLAGAHVVVTGGSSGIGLEVAKECARKGAIITIIARNKDRLNSAKQEIENCLQGGGEKPRVSTLSLDVSGSAEDVANEIKALEDKIGPVDVLVNSAGVPLTGLFEDTPAEAHEQHMKINYFGSLFCTMAVVPGMKQRKKGNIVFVSSIGGLAGFYGYTGYCATKFAIRGLAEALQMEVKPYNIAITVAYPPDTDTSFLHKEEETRLEASRLIAGEVGLLKADNVAKIIVRDTIKGEFCSTMGLEGFFFGCLTIGVSPCYSAITALVQVLLMGPFRIIILYFLKKTDGIISMCLKKENEGKKQN